MVSDRHPFRISSIFSTSYRIANQSRSPSSLQALHLSPVIVACFIFKLTVRRWHLGHLYIVLVVLGSRIQHSKGSISPGWTYFCTCHSGQAGTYPLELDRPGPTLFSRVHHYTWDTSIYSILQTYVPDQLSGLHLGLFDFQNFAPYLPLSNVNEESAVTAPQTVNYERRAPPSLSDWIYTCASASYANGH